VRALADPSEDIRLAATLALGKLKQHAETATPFGTWDDGKPPEELATHVRVHSPAVSTIAKSPFSFAIAARLV
jgi:HEAT repeat protein